jgi:HSP20 family protein
MTFFKIVNTPGLDLLDSAFDSIGKTRSPAFDLEESKTEYVLSADVPGFSKDQIEIDARDATISIRGRFEKDKTSDEVHSHWSERPKRSFQRSVTFPDPIKAENLVASLNNGVLKLVIPKNVVQPSRIEIQ